MTGIKLGSSVDQLRAISALGRSTSALTSAFERLSSGQRINHASDDAAGLSIVEQLKSRSRVFSRAVQNLTDGISAAAIAEGALEALKEISQRQLELATQAANGSYSLKQRQALNGEANKLVQEFNRIVEGTTFNGVNVLSPTLGSIDIQAGYGTAGVLQLGLTDQLKRATGDGGFVLTRTSPASGTYNMGAADFNGDGKLDFVQAGGFAGEILLSIGNGDGTFLAATNITTGGVAQNVTVGDFNGDGKADVIVSQLYAGTAQVLLGNGNGSFRAARTYTTGIEIQSSQAGDVNGDGVLDLVTVEAGANSGRIAVLLGNADGSFKAANVFVGEGPGYSRAALDYSVALGDFNGDGKLDIATTSNNHQIGVFLGRGNGTFGPRSTFSTGAATTATFVIARDFNNDGILDLLSSDQVGSDAVVMLGNGNGSFAAARSVAASLAVFSEDINRDGYYDIVSANGTLFGNGDGSFRSPVSSLGTTPIGFADFNGDGRLDLVDYTGSVSLGTGSYVTTSEYLNINTQQGARNAIDTVTATLNRISLQLGMIGATTSRFEIDINNLRNQRENYLAAAGRIQDADIAASSAELLRQTILQQSAAAVLAHTATDQRLALLLLGG